MGSNTMKGLLKGLRYISNIFEAEEKEPEMQIGFPTDVKHVAHIGWDGPAVSAPSWMSESKPESAEPATAKGKKDSSKSPRDVSCGARNASPRDLPAMPLPKPSKRYSSTSGSAAGSNTESPRAAARHARRHQSNSVGSPDHEKPEGSRHGRRERGATTGGSDIPNYTSATPQQQEQPAAAETKQRRRKSKEKSSTGGSASRSKADRRAVEQQHLPPLKPVREEEEEDGRR